MRILKQAVVSCFSALAAFAALTALPAYAKQDDAKINLSALDSTPVQRYIVGFSQATKGNSAAALAAATEVARGQAWGSNFSANWPPVDTCSNLTVHCQSRRRWR